MRPQPFLFLLLLTACSQESPDKPPTPVLYAGEGRDRLCLAGDRVGFIAFGDADTNCSARGRIGRAGEHLLSIMPDGDQDCRIEVQEQGGTIRLGQMSSACAYYCGPGGRFAGKTFTKNGSATAAVDLAGDPLC